MTFLHLFGNNLLPVFLAAGAGYAVAAGGRVSARPLAHVGFFVLSPCLVYQIIVESHLPLDAFLRMAGFAVASLGILGLGVGLLAHRLRWSRSLTAAVVLAVLLPNAANYGLSVNLFAFGEAGLAQASLFFVTSAVLSYTVGVVVASTGRVGVGRALAGLPRVPAVWAVVAAFAMVHWGWTLPFPATRAVNLLADACIPVFLLVLGMQLHGASGRGRMGPLALATGTRLVGGVAAGLFFAWVFGLHGAARQAGVLEAAMPSAVINIILATEYDVEPAFVTSVVFVTTLLSPLTLTPLLAFLGA